jgi:hypothetical protein
MMTIALTILGAATLIFGVALAARPSWFQCPKCGWYHEAAGEIQPNKPCGVKNVKPAICADCATRI